MIYPDYQLAVQNLAIGKVLPEAVYLHVSALEYIPKELQDLVATAIDEHAPEKANFNLIKFFRRDFKISLLAYPDFFDEPYPCLDVACTIDLAQQKARISQYANSKNPPILHRKETFLHPDHPAVPQFEELTREGENAGLYEKSSIIGFREGWKKVIKRKGYQLVDGRIVPLPKVEPKPAPTPGHAPKIERHRTAIQRYALSVPMQSLANYGFLDGNYSVFDYGCGLGGDVRELQAHQIEATGWDPVHAPDSPKVHADIVNLGFVINVIERPRERAEALRLAYQHANKVLVVSAMLGGETTIQKFKPYGDGVVTERNTFQKYYSQQELKNYIEATLQAGAVAVAPGVFYVFKDELDEQLFGVNRRRVRRQWTMLSQPEKRKVAPKVRENFVEKNKELIEDFWRTCLDYGRLPRTDEFEFAMEIRSLLGSFNKAFEFVIEHFSKETFQKAKEARREDLLVYFALTIFEKRKPYTRLPEGLKRDINEFFGHYKTALTEAKELIFALGQTDLILEDCKRAAHDMGIGHLNGDHDLIVHQSQIHNLPSSLRMYLGCAEVLYGDISDADLVKIHIWSGKVTLQYYNNFETKPLPELVKRVKVKLRRQEIDIFDYTEDYEPQPLYLKSRYLPTWDPNYKKQERFDQKILDTKLFDFADYGPSKENFYLYLEKYGYKVHGFQLRHKQPMAES
jgi:DNA phosphorothioation-associated putative methyltransferase